MRKLLAIISITLILTLLISATAMAAKEDNAKHSQAGNLIEKTKGEHIDGKAKATEVKGHEAEAAWRIPGWQSIFAVIAIVYYVVISLNILPKIAAKEVGDK